MIEIRLAQQGMGMQDGTIVQWLKREADPVQKDEPIAEVEAAKGIVEVTSPVAGVLHRILVQVGTNVPVLTPLALIEEALPTQRVRSDYPAKQHRAEPRAVRAAKERGVDLANVVGTGPEGRITEADVQAASGARMAVKEIRLTAMRGAIASRLQQSKQSAPHFRLVLDVQVDALLALRHRVNKQWPESRISLNDLLVRAAAEALRRVPELNAQFDGQVIKQFENADISVAVALEDGLVTPIIRQADAKSVVQIADEMRDLVGRAKSRQLKPDEWQGGTFSISNLGMFGVKQFDAIINPPQVAILAVGTAESRPIAKDGAVSLATLVTLCLSCDHRVVDGATAARFLAQLRDIVANPGALLASSTSNAG